MSEYYGDRVGVAAPKSPLKSYIGTKIVQAEPMTYHEFSEKIKSCPCPPGDELGYLVIYEDAYRSWSPKAVFERCYREITENEKGLVIG